MACVKERDRPDEGLYEALVRWPTSRSILYVCSPCRKMGSVAKRFACNELELTRAQSELSHATDERLASVRQIESQTNEIERLREEVRQLKVDKVSLNTRVQELGTAPSVVKTETVVSSSDSSSGESPISSDKGSGSHRDSEDTSCRRTAKQSHPLGFREVRSRVVGTRVKMIFSYGWRTTRRP